jgi:hypothetical protein
MFSNAYRVASGSLDVRRRSATALSTILIAALAAMPTASALASAGPTGSGAGGFTKRLAAAVRLQTTPGELLPAGKLEELLAQLPLSSLSAAQLAHYLAGVGGIGALAGLQGLLGKDLGATGVERGLAEAIEQLELGNSSATLGELANVENLLPALEGKLAGLLKLLGSPLSAEQKEALEHAFGSLNLDQLASSLLGSVQPKAPLAAELSNLAGGLFGELTSGELKGLLGSTLTSGFAAKTEGEVAEELHSTPKAVSEALGQTSAELPETATMLTAPLSKGELVGLAPAVKGLALGLLSSAGQGEGGGSGTGGKGSGEGGSGTGEGGKGSSEGSGSGTGQGGNGAGGGGSQGGSGEGGRGGQGGSTGGTTILLTLPAASSSTQAASAAAKHALGKVRILSHKVRGHVATVVLQVPSAGKITLAGRGARSVGAQAAKAERLTLRVSLSKAVVASLRRGHHHGQRVKLKASFKPTRGSGSSATVTVTFT